MNNSLKKFIAWRSRRQLRALARWEEVRAKGRVRFLVQTTLAYSVSVYGLSDFLDHVFPGGTQYSGSLIHTITLPLTGIVIGLVSWSSMESKYRNALFEARIKAAPSGRVSPHRSPLQITVDSESR